MKRFIEGVDRTQTTCFPDRLEDFVSEDNPVRVIDVFINQLDLLKLGFEGVEPLATGRPAYHPSVLLKIYVYGYLNRVHSSRRLERETQRNVELMWLTGRLTPDFKTIADFRKDNGKAIKKVCQQFVMVCRQLNLFTDALVAIDGSKFKAVNNRDKNFTPAKMKSRLERVEKSIERYLAELDSADGETTSIPEAKVARLQDRIATLTEEMERLKTLEEQMLEAPDRQLSLTDPDSRSMKTRGTGIVGYNTQIAVDTKNHLIAAHEVTNVGNDRHQLANMAEQARAAMDVEDLSVVADRGYYNGTEIVTCEEGGIAAYVPKSNTSSNKAKKLFGKSDFVYVAADDEYQCPAGERLIWHSTIVDKGLIQHCYWNTAACAGCSIREQCTMSKERRRIKRWEHEDVLDAMQLRLDKEPEKMQLRRSTVEHPFGTLKQWMGWTHFLTKTHEHVATEMSLHVLAYNLKRVINILGVETLVKEIMRLANHLCRKPLYERLVNLLRSVLEARPPTSCLRFALG